MTEEPAERPVLELDVTGDSSTPVVRICGELDLAGVDAVRQCFDRALAASPERIDVDLSGLAFIDSSGLSTFIEVAKVVPLRMRQPTDAVRRVFEVTGLVDVWELDG